MYLRLSLSLHFPLSSWERVRVNPGITVPRANPLTLTYVGEGGCAGGGVTLGAVPALSWCGEVSLGGIRIIIISLYIPALAPAPPVPTQEAASPATPRLLYEYN